MRILIKLLTAVATGLSLSAMPDLVFANSFSGSLSVNLAQSRHHTGQLTAVPGSQINIRRGPSTSFESVSFGFAGDPVIIIESVGGGVMPAGQISHLWSRVRFVNSGVMGWVRGDFVVHGTAPLSDSCHQKVSQARNEINNVKNGNLESIFSEVNDSPIRGKPYQIVFVLGGDGQSDVLSSPQFMLRISDYLIQNCSNVSSVLFSSNSSGWQDVYGIVNGRVSGFICVDHAPNHVLRWGEYYCGL